MSFAARADNRPAPNGVDNWMTILDAFAAECGRSVS